MPPRFFTADDKKSSSRSRDVVAGAPKGSLFPSEKPTPVAARTAQPTSTSLFTYEPVASSRQTFVRTKHRRGSRTAYGISPAEVLRLMGPIPERWRKRAGVVVVGLPILLVVGLASTMGTNRNKEVTPTRVASPAISLPATTPTPAQPGTAQDVAVVTETSDITAVQSLLSRYRSAFAALDAEAVKALWPTANLDALSHAFDQLQVQKLDFDTCHINLTGPQATVECSGTARFVPRIGGNNIRVESRHWTFYLLRANGTWIVEHVESR
jgi:hypothetical protein